MPRPNLKLSARAQQRVVEAFRHETKKDPRVVLANLVHDRRITEDQAKQLVSRGKHIFDMLKVQRDALTYKSDAVRDRDPATYGLAGKLFEDAATHAMKAGLNSYANVFLREALKSKLVARAPQEEIIALRKTIKDLA